MSAKKIAKFLFCYESREIGEKRTLVSCLPLFKIVSPFPMAGKIEETCTSFVFTIVSYCRIGAKIEEGLNMDDASRVVQ